MSLLLATCVAALVGGGVWLLMHHDALRAVLGAALLGHGVVLLLVLQGRAGDAPLVDRAPPQALSDPVPQALALTAIVIGLGVVAYLLVLHRDGDDEEEER